MPRGRHSSRTRPLPANWRTEIQPRILDRDQHACQWPIAYDGTKCGAYAYRVDHKKPAHLGGTDEDANLWALCDHHTRKKDSAEGGRAAQALRPKRARPQDPHPGLLA
jgi:5-methylcytosine-specific restriction endonuclease McrA